MLCLCWVSVMRIGMVDIGVILVDGFDFEI